MKKKEIKKKKHYGIWWIGGSNISAATRKAAREFLEDGGTVYWLEGTPPPTCPPGSIGCPP
jgi:hypothetical protein